jgi:hypothetical protein
MKRPRYRRNWSKASERAACLKIGHRLPTLLLYFVFGTSFMKFHFSSPKHGVCGYYGLPRRAMRQLRELCVAFAVFSLLNAQGFAEDAADHNPTGITKANGTLDLGHRSAMVKKSGGALRSASNCDGATPLGGASGIRPSWAVERNVVRTDTVVSPRQQFLVGMIYTVRPGLAAPQGKACGGIARR